MEWVHKLVVRAKKEVIVKVPRIEGRWEDWIIVSASDAAYAAQMAIHKEE